MKAAIYCRVSTPGQEEDGTSLTTQEERCQDYAAKRAYDVEPGHIYREARSGALLRERTELMALLKAARDGKFQVVVVYAFDRLSRGEVEIFHYLRVELAQHGVAIESVTEKLDSGRAGQLMLSVLGFVAGVERDKITERTQRGKRAKAEAGRVTPASDKFGYKRDKERGVLVIVEAEAELVRQIYKWFVSDGMSMNGIATRLNEMGIPSPRGSKWGQPQLNSMFRNPAYKGRGVAFRTGQKVGPRRIRPEADWIELPDGAVPAIISAEIWDQAARRLADNKGEFQRNRRNPLLLRGFVYCSVCGRRMYSRMDVITHNVYWSCSSKARTNVACGGKMARQDKLEPWVREKLRMLASDDRLVNRLVDMRAEQDTPSVEPEIATCNMTLEQLGRQDARWLNAYSEGVISVEELKGQRSKLQEQKAATQARIAALLQVEAAHKQALERFTALSEWCARLAKNFDSLSFDQLRDLMQSFDIRVLIGDGDWKIQTWPNLQSLVLLNKTP